MTNSSPRKPWPIEIDDFPSINTSIDGWDFPWRTVSHNQMVDPIPLIQLPELSPEFPDISTSIMPLLVLFHPTGTPCVVNRFALQHLL